MPSKQGPDGIWRWRKEFTHEGVKYGPKSGTPEINTKAACDAHERRWIESITNPLEHQAKKRAEDEARAVAIYGTHAGPTVKQLIKKYEALDKALAASGDKKPGSVRSRWTRLKGRILAFFGDMPAGSIKQGDITRYISERIAASQTVKNEIYALFALLGMAADDDLVERHGLRCKVGQRATKRKQLIRAVSLSDVALLVDESQDPRLAFAILAGAEAGLRIGEIRGLEWPDVATDEIHVQREIDALGNVLPPKNGEERWVAMTPGIRAALKRLQKAQATIGGYVVQRLDVCMPSDKRKRKPRTTKTSPGNSVSYNSLHKSIRAIYKRAGVVTGHANGIHPWHSLRHTFGSRLVREGMELSDVRRIMGHKDVRVTDRYITATREQLKTEMRRIFGAAG